MPDDAETSVVANNCGWLADWVFHKSAFYSEWRAVPDDAENLYFTARAVTVFLQLFKSVFARAASVPSGPARHPPHA